MSKETLSPSEEYRKGTAAQNMTIIHRMMHMPLPVGMTEEEHLQGIFATFDKTASLYPEFPLGKIFDAFMSTREHAQGRFLPIVQQNYFRPAHPTAQPLLTDLLLLRLEKYEGVKISERTILHEIKEVLTDLEFPKGMRGKGFKSLSDIDIMEKILDNPNKYLFG